MDEPGKQDVTLAELYNLIAAHMEWERGFFTEELPLLLKASQPLAAPAITSRRYTKAARWIENFPKCWRRPMAR